MPSLNRIWRRSGGGWAGQRIEFGRSNNVFLFIIFFQYEVPSALQREVEESEKSIQQSYASTYKKCCCEQDVADTAIGNNVAGVLLTALPDSLKCATNIIILWMNCTICDIYYQFSVRNFSSGTLCQICIHKHMRENHLIFRSLFQTRIQNMCMKILCNFPQPWNFSYTSTTCHITSI